MIMVYALSDTAPISTIEHHKQSMCHYYVYMLCLGMAGQVREEWNEY
jgi:hypothetical protein